VSLEVVDAHVHLWRLTTRPQPWINPITMARIDRDFTADDLAAAGAAAGVNEMVLVQVLNRRDETEDHLLEASTSVLIQGVVGWVDLEAVDVSDQLDRLASRPGGDRLAGIRHQAQAEPDPGEWIVRPHVRRGFAEVARRGLVCELMMRPAQLDQTYKVVRTLPGVTFVLNHCGKPPVASGWATPASNDWARQVKQLATANNVICKLSGLTTMADLATWQTEDLRPFVDTLIDAFGPHRLLFGSDWPVSLRAGDYRRTVNTASELLGQLDASESQQVLAGNARRIYNLKA
jgi:L-fucono-1,5-lactonase